MNQESKSKPKHTRESMRGPHHASLPQTRRDRLRLLNVRGIGGSGGRWGTFLRFHGIAIGEFTPKILELHLNLSLHVFIFGVLGGVLV